MELLGARAPLGLSAVPFGRKPAPTLVRLGPGPHAVPPRPS
jgi:hypothetical protein